MLLQVLILILLHECHAQLHSFPIDYIGNQLSLAEYKELNVCETRVCQEDATRFFSCASHKNDSDPCVNFNDFACGNFNKFQSISYDKDLKLEDQHRLKTILSKDIHEDEPKIFKIVKRYFQKCISSDYVTIKGKAEILNLLSEFGKFPLLESNWNSTDFNVTETLTAIEEGSVSMSYHNRNKFTNNMVRDMLHLDLGLSHDLISEIINGFEEENDNFRKTIVSYWNEQISNLYEYEFILSKNSEECFELLDLEIRKKLANCFMIIFLMDKIDFFSFNSKLEQNKQAQNRDETCIKQLRETVEFPLYIMYEIKYKSEIDEGAVKDFIHKVFLMSFDTVSETTYDKLKDAIMATPIYVGLPDELTTTEFLNNIYANLKLTGEEGLYKMNQEMIKYDAVIRDEEYYTNYVKTLSENAKDIFKKCKFSNLQQNCYEANNFFVFRIDNIIYPNFHPERPYFVNLAYLFDEIKDAVQMSAFKYVNELKLSKQEGSIFYDLNIQDNYLKYVTKFGAEQSLPGFLMTNQQMIEFIQYQKQCNNNDGTTPEYKSLKNIFNC